MITLKRTLRSDPGEYPSSSVLSFPPLLTPWSHASGAMRVHSRFWGHSLRQAPRSTAPEPCWLPFTLRPITGPLLKTPFPGDPFSPCTGVRPLLPSILRSTWGACGHAGFRPIPGPHLTDVVGSGIWILSSPDNSDAGGPRQDYPAQKINLLLPQSVTAPYSSLSFQEIIPRWWLYI